MILFAVATQQSVAACFAASIVPGLLLMVGLILFNRSQIGRHIHEIRSARRQSPAEKLGVSIRALPVLLLTSFIPALSLSLPRWLGLL